MYAPRIAFRSPLLPTAALLLLLVGLCLPHPGGISPTPPGGLWAALGGGGTARAQAPRIATPFNGDTPTRVSGAISSDTTWSARRSPYLVSSTVSVGGNANLVIEPGVEVRFAAGASLNVGFGSAGGIDAVGTAAKPIVFTSSAATKTAGSWGSVALSSHTKKTSRIAHARIEYAQTGISLDGVPNGVSLRSSSIRNTSRQGIFIGRSGSAAVLSGWSVSRSGSYALNAPRASAFRLRGSTLRGRVNAPGAVRAVWGPGNTLTDFGAWAVCVPPNLVEAVAASVPKDGVLRVKGGTLSQSASWPARTYAILGVITVQGNTAPMMTLAAGTTLRFGSDAGISVGQTAPGGLVAVGTAAAPILFTADAASPSAGAWRGLAFYGKTLATSRVEFSTLEYGYRGFYLSAVPAGVRFRDGTIRHTWWHGVELNAGTASLERWTIAEVGSTRHESFFAGGGATHFVLNDSTIHGAVYADSIPSFAISGSTLRGGLFAPNAEDAVLRDNTYHASAVTRVHPNLVEAVAVGTVGATAQTVLGVSGGTLRASASWPARTYAILGVITVQGNMAPMMTLAAGTTLRFGSDAGISVGQTAPGGLVAVGTAAAPILFTADAASPSAGAWRGLAFYGKTLATSRVEFSTLEYGYRGFYLSAVPAGVRFRDGTIRHTWWHGVELNAGTASLERWTIAEVGSTRHESFFAGGGATHFVLNDSTIHGAVYADSIPSFAISGSTLRGGLFAPNAEDAVLRDNTYHASAVTRVHPNLVEAVAVGTVGATAQTVLGVSGGTLRASASWPARTYAILGVITVQGNMAPMMTLAAGTTLRFGSDAGISVGQTAPGGLVAVGTAAAPILFTADAASPSAGAWRGLAFYGKTLATSRVEFSTLEYGYRGFYLSAVPAGVRFRDGTIRHTWWHGVELNAGTASLERWTIAEVGSTRHESFFAGGGATHFVLNDSTIHGAVYADSIPSFAISGSTLRGGLFAPNAEDAVLRDNTYHASAVTRVHPNLVEAVAVGTVGATAQTVLGVSGGTLRASASWPARTYAILGVITVQGNMAPMMTLAAGTTLRFGSDAGISVGQTAPGGLVAVGTAAAPILFTADAASPSAGAWRGLAFYGKTLATSRVEFSTLEYGYRGFYLSAVPAGVRLRDGTIRHTWWHGVELNAGTASLERWTIAEVGSTRHESFFAGGGATHFVLNDSTIHGAVYADSIPSFAISGSTLRGGLFAPNAEDAVLRDNTYHASAVTRVHPNLVEAVAVGTVGATAQTVLGVSGGTLRASASWPARTYAILGVITVQGNTAPMMTLAAGTTLRFGSDAGLAVGERSKGGVVALGTATAPILFTADAAKPVAGAWRGIWLYGKTLATSRLEFSTIEYSQWGVWLSGVPAGVRLRRGTIRHTSRHGLYLQYTSPTISHWTISSTAQHGVSSLTGSPQLSHLTITGAGGDGVNLNGFSGRLEHSTITTSAGDGVECGSGGQIELFDNRITGNTGRGLACAAAAHAERNTITGNGVGVELTAAPALLALHHNDLSGNTVPMKSTATAGVDARWNWWGGATGPSGIVGKVRADPWLGAAPTAPFRIEGAVASPESFAPGGSASTTTVTAQTPQAATWSLALRNGAGTTVRSFTGTGTSFSTAWDGKNTASQALPVGSYRYTLSAQPSAAGGTAAAPVVGDLSLVAGDLVAEIADPGPEASLRKEGSLVVRGRALGTGFSAYELDYAAGADPGASSFIRIARGTTAVATAATLGTWNTSSLSQGIYTLRLRTTGADSAAVEERVTLALLELGAVAVSPGHFSPNGDGRRDEVTASATATARGAWTAQVRNAAGTVLRSYSGTGSRPRVVWDGRNTAGTLQSEGTYTVALGMGVDVGKALEATGTVTLDVTPPQAVITAPAANSSVLDYDETITGTASDLHFASYELRSSAAGRTVVVLKSGTTAVVAGTLGTLTDSVIAPRYVDGPSHTLELFVEDRAGNRATTTRTLRFDRIHLSGLSVVPQTIDPEQDETVRIAYRLSHPATVTVQMVADRMGGPTVTLVENQSASPGSLTTTWNGKDAAGKPLARDLYHPRITARDAAGRSAVYDAANASLPAGPRWSQAQFNGKDSPREVEDFNPYRNDEFRIDYQMSKEGRHTLRVGLLGPEARGQQLLLRNQALVPKGANHVIWTGRLANGKPYTGGFRVLFGLPDAISDLSLLVWSPEFRVESFRANPYVLRPAHAQVVHISYTLQRAAQVQVDIVDPDGNHWLQLQAATARQPGAHKLTWSGRNAAGKIAAPEGLYTIEVTATETGGRSERTVRRGNLLVYR